MPSAPPSRLGRYQLAHRIGVGGMSELYVARFTRASEVNRTCVVKRLLPELAQQPPMVAMFLDEARINLLLDHPAIVSVFDLGYDHGDYYMAMEHVDGHDLRWILSACARSGLRFPPRLAFHLGARILEALTHAHQACTSDGTPLGLVHRDVSPENVLVDREGNVKLGDFGAAQSTISQTRVGRDSTVGKIEYMAPETMRFGTATPASDLFSIAAVIFEAVSGHRLVTARNAEEALDAWQQFDPTRDVPRRVSLADGGAMLVRALDQDPARRWASADRFLREVQEYLLRRGRGVKSADLGEFVRGLEGTATESGRVFTAPVDLPTTQVQERGSRQFLYWDGRIASGPDATEALDDASGAPDALICSSGQYWRPLADVRPAVVRGVRPRRVSRLEFGPTLRGLEGRWRVAVWLKQQILALQIDKGRVIRAMRFHPSSGEPVTVAPGEPQGGVGSHLEMLVSQGLIGPEQIRSLQRRELRAFLAIPTRWDEMWMTWVPADESAVVGGIPLPIALLDAAHEVGSGARFAPSLGLIGHRKPVATQASLPPEADAALYAPDRTVLSEVRRGLSYSALQRRHQADPVTLFDSLFALHHGGWIELS